jgi:predicted ribosome quality control (RQC) complex YloA/Tae2 family protein
VSLRLANIYDLNTKILLLKFAKPDNKKQLLIESGFRCHLTEFARTAASAPSVFVARLRKFLKTRRVTSVSQIGTDRIIEIQFSDGAYRLYLEFFASGNVILTDSELKILTLMHTVPEGEGQEPQRIGLNYKLENRQNYGGVPPLTKERLRSALETTVERAAAPQTAGKKGRRKPGDELRRGLATTITELPPMLVEHAFKVTDFDPTSEPRAILENQALFDALLESLRKARSIIDEVTSQPTSKGYIVAKRRTKANTTEGEAESQPEDKHKDLLYEDFHPFLPKKFEEAGPDYTVLTFDGFNKTVDEFFSSLEGQRLESRLSEREAAARRKLDAARQDQAKRLEGLQEAQQLNERKAAAIQANVERVQEAMDAVNGLLQQGMDWVDINKLVAREQKLGNPVAQLIKLPMDLENNIITLTIGEEEEEEEEEIDDFDYDTDSDAGADEEEEDKPKATSAPKWLEVDIKLDLTPWANSSEYYEQKRTAAVKAEKTLQQSEMALKSAEQKIAQDLKKGLKQEKAVLQPLRRQMWFEKFTWFISSDGYLVLGGRDVQQNDILYKKYLRKGDIYVHADLHGASSVIIKNNPKTPDAPVPPSTLSQAGTMSVCSSSAWDSKAGMSAWWVRAEQVSKAAPTGQFLPAGSFMIRGEKNFLPPAQLVLGFALMFRLSEESKAKHVKHRIYERDDFGPRSAPKAEEADKHGDEEGHTESGHASEDEVFKEQRRSNPLQPGRASGPEQEPDEDSADDEEDTLQDDEALTEQVANLDVDDETPQGEQRATEEDREAEQEEEQPSTLASEQPPSTATPSSSAQPPKKGPLPRGKRSKAKKLAAKYKWEDEEDRALREEATGIAAAKRREEEARAARAAKEAEAKAAAENRRKAEERRQKQAAEHEEKRALLLAEGIDLLDPEEADQMSLVDELVGHPLPGDEILEIIPVCAPWSALGKCKYKAKIQPGSQKKGKAVKEIVEAWRIASGRKGVIDENAQDPERMWPREVELIKALKTEEAMNCVPVGKVRVMMSGGSGGGGGGGGGKGKDTGGKSAGKGKGGNRGQKKK